MIEKNPLNNSTQYTQEIDTLIHAVDSIIKNISSFFINENHIQLIEKDLNKKSRNILIKIINDYVQLKLINLNEYTSGNDGIGSMNYQIKETLGSLNTRDNLEGIQNKLKQLVIFIQGFNNGNPLGKRKINSIQFQTISSVEELLQGGEYNMLYYLDDKYKNISGQIIESQTIPKVIDLFEKELYKTIESISKNKIGDVKGKEKKDKARGIKKELINKKQRYENIIRMLYGISIGKPFKGPILNGVRKSFAEKAKNILKNGNKLNNRNLYTCIDSSKIPNFDYTLLPKLKTAEGLCVVTSADKTKIYIKSCKD